MSGLTTTKANALLDADLKNGTPFIALTSTLPTASSAGTELTGSNYSRLSASYATASAQATSLSAVGQWATPLADWTAAVGFNVYDAATSGNRLYWGPLPVTITAKNGVPLISPVGAFVVTLAST